MVKTSPKIFAPNIFPPKFFAPKFFALNVCMMKSIRRNVDRGKLVSAVFDRSDAFDSVNHVTIICKSFKVAKEAPFLRQGAEK